MNMSVIVWGVTPCVLQRYTNILKEPAASTSLKIVADGCSKTPCLLAQALTLLTFHFYAHGLNLSQYTGCPGQVFS
jgi:hypothetical protein